MLLIISELLTHTMVSLMVTPLSTVALTWPFYMFLFVLFFLMIRRPPRSTLDRSSAASDVYKRQVVTEIVHRAVEAGPVLFLLGRQLQFGLDPLDIRIAVGDDLFGGQLRSAVLGQDLSLIHISEPTRPY